MGRRGVVFIKEIVPRLAIAAVARLRYRERYIAAPMRSRIDDDAVEFSWRIRGAWNCLRADLSPDAPWQESAPGSEEEFISEHYWGYSDRAAGGRRTLEYAVEHPRWQVRAVRNFRAELPGAETLYGAALARTVRAGAPSSVFLAAGSAVKVYRGVPLLAA